MSLNNWVTRIRGSENSFDNEVRILAIDPGTDTMGVCLSIVDLHHRTHYIDNLFTLHAARQVSYYQSTLDIHGARQARFRAHTEMLLLTLDSFRPHCVISESPFMGKFAAAYGALTECMSVIRAALYQYDPTIPLETVDPPSAKKSVGVKARGGTKKDVEDAIIADRGILWSPYVSKYGHEEHEYDAGAVARFKAKQLLGLL